ncbi:helix-turn-helix domain-containing protein [Photobacterium leiognathi]|uniref:helix-turn-helix domain-containing protein n=1 Tax=Photobacterium leiognathi TaxID=553611 RepID=UPI00298244F1|nr:helix-turn-helix domain-containing protein [Photobacterium leiognathi]
MQEKIPQIAYLGGRDVTEKLKEITQVRDFKDLTDIYDIPSSTLSTWHTRNITPYEIILRTAITTGCSVKWLALGEGDAFEKTNSPVNDDTYSFAINRIVNGQMLIDGQHRISSAMLRNGLNELNTIVIEDNDTLFFINKDEITPTSGRYLIRIDDVCSINRIQRLPGKKLMITIGDSTMTVSDDEIEVIGRVAMTLGSE